MIDIKKLYYAHHMFKYNTKEEKQEIELIEKKFPNFLIINPNEWICQDNSEQAIMNQCYHFVKMSDILVFSSLNTIIGRGVHEEVQLALEENKDVYLICYCKELCDCHRRLVALYINEKFNVEWKEYKGE